MRKEARRELPRELIDSNLRAKVRAFFFLRNTENRSKLLNLRDILSRHLGERHAGLIYDFFWDLNTLCDGIVGWCDGAMKVASDRDPSIGAFALNDQNKVIIIKKNGEEEQA